MTKLKLIKEDDSFVGGLAFAVDDTVSRGSASHTCEALSESLRFHERDYPRQDVGLISLCPRHPHNKAQPLPGLERQGNLLETPVQILEVVFEGILAVASPVETLFELDNRERGNGLTESD
jgi:hypothetical protein